MTRATDRILRLAGQRGVIRASDFPDLKQPQVRFKRLVERGELIRLARGLYAVPSYEVSLHHNLAIVARTAPSLVVCLLSALAFHGFTTQSPSSIWVARTSGKTRTNTTVPIKIVRMSRSTFAFGVEIHQMEEAHVRVFSPAKTVADCFKFRNTVGLDVAIEALREGWREKRFTMDELWAAVKVCRVQNVIRPYAEMLVS